MNTDVLIMAKRAAAPPMRTGRAAVYAKTDGNLYFVNEDGIEAQVAMAAALDISNAWPIGSVFIAVVSTNPNVLVGFGTWVRFGQGKMLVSQSGSDADFDVAEETGGAKTHTQTVGELATHTHVQNSHNHTQDPHTHTISTQQGSLGSPLKAASSDGTATGAPSDNATTATNQATTAVNQNTGSADPMNIMNPYIVVYMWKRTA